MAKKAMKVKQQRKQKFGSAADRMLTFASMVFAGFASVSLLTRARFRESEKQAGRRFTLNENEIMIEVRI